MPKFTVNVVRSVRQTAAVEVVAKDKRTAALTAGGSLAMATWTDIEGGDVKITNIEKVEAPAPLPESAAPTRRGRGRRVA